MGGRSKVRADYSSSLADLTFNCKPLISLLTISAEENLAYAKDIVQIIENHLLQVRTEVKLPVLYLIDCIIKNVGDPYKALFHQNIVSTFCNVFKQVDEKTRADLLRLRQTWNNVIPLKQLHTLDVQLTRLDPTWSARLLSSGTAPIYSKVTRSNAPIQKTHSMQLKIIDKQCELLELQQRKLQLEVLQGQMELQKRLQHQTTGQMNSSVPTAQLQKNPTRADPRISVRDPRLFRQLEQNLPPAVISCNVHLDTKILIKNKGDFEPPCKSKTLSHSSPPNHAQKIADLPKKASKLCHLSKSPDAASVGPLTKINMYGQLPGVTIESKATILGSDQGLGGKPARGLVAVVKKRVMNSKGFKRGDDSKLLSKSGDLKGSNCDDALSRNQEAGNCWGRSIEKQFEIQDKPKSTPNQTKDLAKQQLAPEMRRKRLSNEPRKSPNAKKKKSDILDNLFGKEDTDMRQSPPLQPPQVFQHPPTHPQPQIPHRVCSPEAKNKIEANESHGELQPDFTSSKPINTNQNHFRKDTRLEVQPKKESILPQPPLRQMNPKLPPLLKHQDHQDLSSRRGRPWRGKPRRQRWGEERPRRPAPKVEALVQPVAVPQPTVDINELFKRLVATGMVAPAAPPQAPPSPDFAKPETLKIRCPSLVKALYQGMQCGSCGMRFDPEQDGLYSQHLDWHFRQNHKKNIRKTFSRLWYYSHSDWINYEEVEDLGEREKCFFESQQLKQDSDDEVEIPCVPTDSNVQDAACEVCWEKFEQFFSEEKDEWQLSMAKRVDGKTYHPLCYEDYQASVRDRSLDDSRLNAVHNSGNPPDGIPLLETPHKEEPKTESALRTETLEDGYDDDVIINEIVPEQIVIDDDDDDMITVAPTQSAIQREVVKEQPTHDEFINMNSIQLVKIKTEPMDYDEAADAPKSPVEDTTLVDVVSLIDGNVELNVSAPASVGSTIKINITKPTPVIVHKDPRDLLFSHELSSNENLVDKEPVQVALKPALKDVDLKQQPTVKKGAELSGLCSIM